MFVTSDIGGSKAKLALRRSVSLRNERKPSAIVPDAHACVSYSTPPTASTSLTVGIGFLRIKVHSVKIINVLTFHVHWRVFSGLWTSSHVVSVLCLNGRDVDCGLPSRSIL